MAGFIRSAVGSKLRDWLDSQITKRLEPFLEMGTDPDGNVCSDFVINTNNDISIDNMILKTEVLNDILTKQGSPLRVSMLRCHKFFLEYAACP